MNAGINEESNSLEFFASRLSCGQTARIAAVALFYFVTARISLSLAFQPEGIAAIWPPSGIFLSAILLTRRSARPYMVAALLVADFIAELLTGTPLFVSAVYALELSGDAVLSSWLLIRFVGEPITFRKVREVVLFLALAVIFSNGLLSLAAASASSLVPETSFWNSWKWWVASSGIGNLLVTPFILSWASWAKTRLWTWNSKKTFESVALFISLAILNLMAFSYLSKSDLFSLFLPYLSFPFLLWSALRFEVRGLTMTLVILAAFTIPLVASGRVAGFHESQLGTVIVLQLYLALMAVPSLFLAAIVTERKQAEDALFKSEEKFRTIFDRASDGILIADATTKKFLLGNTAICSMLGYAKEKIESLTVHDIHPPEDLTHVLDMFAKHIKGEIVLAESLPVLRKDGSIFYADISITHTTIGKRDYLAGIFRDITQRRQAEEALAEAARVGREWQSTFDATNDAIWILDQDQRVLRSNRTAERFFHHPFGEFIGKHCWEIVHGTKQPIPECPVLRMRKSLRRETMELLIGEHWFEVIVDPILDAADRYSGAVHIVNDITDRKRAEEKILASLLEKETMLKEIHHRVKNNLQVISSLLGLQSSYIHDEESRKAFQESRDRVKVMADIHTMLYQSEDLARVDFGRFIRDMVSRLRQSYGIGGTPIEVLTDIADVCLTVEISVPCGLILNELVSNALKHVFPEGKGGNIHIKMRSEGYQVVLTVQDNGVGLPESVDFCNVQSLGLELVNLLVGQINGAIDLQVEGGTTFTITFPAANKDGAVKSRH